jgi:hypothetical protein
MRSLLLKRIDNFFFFFNFFLPFFPDLLEKRKRCGALPHFFFWKKGATLMALF